MPVRTVYRFYAELCGYSPKIWRRFQCDGSVTMAYFGYILMTMFEMQAGHYFAFDVPHAENFDRQMAKRIPDYEPMKNEYDDDGDAWRIELPAGDKFDFGAAFPDLPEAREPEILDAAAERLHNILPEAGDRALFTYDLGDGWEVGLRVDEILRKCEIPASDLPKALAGEGRGIIENCGGPDGLKKIAAALKRKRGPQYQNFCELLGTDAPDLAAFDIDDMNFRLKKVPTIYRKIYEDNRPPSRQAAAILERRYKK